MEFYAQSTREREREDEVLRLGPEPGPGLSGGAELPGAAVVVGGGVYGAPAVDEGGVEGVVDEGVPETVIQQS